MQPKHAWWREPIINLGAAPRPGGPASPQPGEWWHNTVIYQISPTSFQDSDGDGRGDLPGLIRRLDYITSLGVDAIWLTPVYCSPMQDMGYDVTDACAIDPSFGSIDDFQRLLALVHQRGMKLVMDMVLNHTSDAHHWFRESRTSRDNPKADWYVWADPAEDGGPPNNWPSVLTGKSGWKFEQARGQYYFYNFFESQPDLNWHHPEVREAMLKIARFWLEQGVDGMRLDAVNFYCHDPQLRDNPVRGDDDGEPDGIDPDNPAAEQVFRNSFCRPETHKCLGPLRELVSGYPGTMLLGEVTLCEDSIAEAAAFTEGAARLHLAYHSGLLFKDPISAAQLVAIAARTAEAYGDHGICWMAGNHDYGRMRSLWGGAGQEDPDAFYRMMAAVLLALPGALCLWQGDELGLPEARIPEDIAPDQLRDPFGRMMYPTLHGRDGSRTPMPWDDAQHACGFTSADAPHLPVPDAHRALSVARQDSDPASMLNTWRTLLHWRIGQAALGAGSMQLLEVPAPLAGWIREHETQRMLVLFNVSGEPQSHGLPQLDAALRPVGGLGFQSDWDAEHRRLRLPPWGVFFAELPAGAAAPDRDSK
ncbi:MAG: alpha-glucosidase [Proteobacteria bacterium]|nr:alpha-glucosidase [Pseudomonadota bacterium]